MARDRDTSDRDTDDEPVVGWGRALLPLGVILAFAALLVIGSLVYRAAS